MHDGMQYDTIQGRGQGHEPFNSPFIQGESPKSSTLTSQLVSTRLASKPDA